MLRLSILRYPRSLVSVSAGSVSLFFVMDSIKPSSNSNVLGPVRKFAKALCFKAPWTAPEDRIRKITYQQKLKLNGSNGCSLIEEDDQEKMIKKAEIEAAMASQLQIAQSPYDPDAIRSADETVVDEVKRLSELKQRYLKKGTDPNPHVTTLSAEIQEQTFVFKTNEFMGKKMETELKIKDSDITLLREKLNKIRYTTTSHLPPHGSTEARQEFSNLCSVGNLKEAFNRFKNQIWADPSQFSLLLQACVPENSLSQGKQLHSLILTSGCSSDKFISNHLLNMYAKCGDLDSSTSLFNVMPRRNFMSWNILIGGFIQNGDLESAHHLFEEMPDRNVASWNAMVTGFTQFEFNEHGLDLFYQMHGMGLRADEFTLGSVLRGCAGLKDLRVGLQIHSYVMKSGFDCNLVVACSLAHMYMKCGSTREGEKVLELMPIHNVVACNTIIAGRAQNGFSEGALDQFYIMKMGGFRPDKITFVSVISSCSELATLGQGQQIHAEAIKSGADSAVSVISSLVSMYSRCGCLEESVKAFTESEDFDVVLWSSMIAAYGFHGHGHEAIGLFEQMEKKGLEPNDVTFLSLLYACSHSGLKAKGVELFYLMINEYKLKPRLEHYTCMVDLLGRSGCLEEAEALIRSMPMNPDAIIWKTLLSACKIHKNMDMATRISEEVLCLDPKDSASYVLLANIHASAKSWNDVSHLRKAMRDKKVKKEPGISWLEVKNQVHQFCIGDRSHPKWNEIEGYLKELNLEMKERGYVPDTGSVLHDMEVEEKEYNLAYHSERVAIAFAMLNTPAGAPVRIMKNLRVCNDCHVVIKFISEITNREIVVRDASRFHHFRDGRCSCGDYW